MVRQSNHHIMKSFTTMKCGLTLSTEQRPTYSSSSYCAIHNTTCVLKCAQNIRFSQSYLQQPQVLWAAPPKRQGCHVKSQINAGDRQLCLRVTLLAAYSRRKRIIKSAWDARDGNGFALHLRIIEMCGLKWWVGAANLISWCLVSAGR